MLTSLRRLKAYLELPGAARAARRNDRAGAPPRDPGIDAVVRAGIDWLGCAQDRSASADGGVARDYSLIDGWSSSYPETTGYIVPTLLEQAGDDAHGDAAHRARRMLDWLVSIQLPGGGFQGGRIDQRPVVPVTFNTGQILLGLAAGARDDPDYLEPMHAAAAWLRDSLDDDGCWRSHPTPFAKPGEKAYETHVAWGLFEAERIAPGEGYADAGLRNVRWALERQASNGWVSQCCLSDAARPLTHTLGYFLKGVVEAHRLGEDPDLLERARRTADGLLTARRADGALPGRLDADWRGAVPWVCLTGQAQIAWSWLYLFERTGDERYLDAATAANAFVRRTVRVEGPEEIRGAVKGSFPVDGEYGRYAFLNWACKFTIDANRYESRVRAQAGAASAAG